MLHADVARPEAKERVVVVARPVPRRRPSRSSMPRWPTTSLVARPMLLPVALKLHKSPPAVTLLWTTRCSELLSLRDAFHSLYLSRFNPASNGIGSTLLLVGLLQSFFSWRRHLFGNCVVTNFCCCQRNVSTGHNSALVHYSWTFIHGS